MAEADDAVADIGNVEIDPTAEDGLTASANSARAEDNFFKAGGIEERLRHNQQNLGWLGRFFGANSSAPTNIAGFVIVCSFVVYVISFCFTGSPDLSDMRKLLGGLITTALGFIVGAATKK
jgi:hypothetical protein